MGRGLRIAGVLTGAMLLWGCVVYPYSADFVSCDNRAGVCYRTCEAYAGGFGYGECHARCEGEANRCFDAAYAPYAYETAYAPWYGTYGAWYPNSGYFVSFSVIQRGHTRYDNYSRRRYDPYYDDRDHRGRGEGGRRDRADDDHGKRGGDGRRDRRRRDGAPPATQPTPAPGGRGPRDAVTPGAPPPPTTTPPPPSTTPPPPRTSPPRTRPAEPPPRSPVSPPSETVPPLEEVEDSGIP